MGLEKNIPPTIEEAQAWPITMTYFQKENNCDLTIKTEDPSTIIPANPDWKKTTLLEETNGKIPNRLIELPGGERALFSYSYRN